jgi:hypothetical protein
MHNTGVTSFCEPYGSLATSSPHTSCSARMQTPGQGRSQCFWCVYVLCVTCVSVCVCVRFLGKCSLADKTKLARLLIRQKTSQCRLSLFKNGLSFIYTEALCFTFHIPYRTISHIVRVLYATISQYTHTETYTCANKHTPE